MSILCLVSHFSCHFHSLYCCCAWRSQGAELLTIHWRKSQPLCCMMQLYFQTGVECPCDDAFSLPSFWTSTHLKHLLWMWVPWCGHSFCALSYIDGKKTGWWEGIDGCKNMENGLSKEVVYECFSSTIILSVPACNFSLMCIDIMLGRQYWCGFCQCLIKVSACGCSNYLGFIAQHLYHFSAQHTNCFSCAIMPIIIRTWHSHQTSSSHPIIVNIIIHPPLVPCLCFYAFLSLFFSSSSLLYYSLSATFHVFSPFGNIGSILSVSGVCNRLNATDLEEIGFSMPHLLWN